MSDPAMADHAELARLAEAAKRVRRDAIGRLDGDDAHRIWFAFVDAVSNPARVLALLAEIAALRGRPLWSATEFNAIVEGLCKQLQTETFRATQAERQRDEAAGLVGLIVGDAFGCNEDSCLVSHRMISEARTFLASMGPKT